METNEPKPNIKLTVPFFIVTDMEASLRFYVDGLGFEVLYSWTPRGKIEWCYLKREGAALMLQQPRNDIPNPWKPEGKTGIGVHTCFFCEDALALYHEFIAKGINAEEPFVSNNMWSTTLRDPDDYRLEFESSTDVPEGTKLSEWK